MNTLFASLPLREPPPELATQILTQVHRLRLRRLWARFAVVCSATVGMLTLLWVYSPALQSEISGSPLTALVRLILSDPDVLARSAQDVFFAFLEATPFVSLLAGLCLLFLSLSLYAVARPLYRERRAFILHSFS
ncbi:hypothetical protein KBA73_04985 [Patescibacteria group bacterium]|nr:hypothetical protein [Patescibacteria group bacterium]